MNLKKMLMELGNSLVLEEAFAPAAALAVQARAEARRCGNSTYPILLFTEWLNRTPEARERLKDAGLDWAVVAEAVQSEFPEPRAVSMVDRGALAAQLRSHVTEPVLTGEETFRVKELEGRYKIISVNQSTGHVHVESVGDGATKRIVIIKLEQVEQPDLPLVGRLVKHWRNRPKPEVAKEVAKSVMPEGETQG